MGAVELIMYLNVYGTYIGQRVHIHGKNDHHKTIYESCRNEGAILQTFQAETQMYMSWNECACQLA